MVGQKSIPEPKDLARPNLLLQSYPIINSSIELSQIAQALTSVAFSLWRAVFLSDLTEDADDQMADLTLFLGNLISNNTIAYQQDKNTREFTARYYLSDANMRLTSIVRKTPAVLNSTQFVEQNTDIRSDWTAAQTALDTAVARFGERLAVMSENSE